MPHTKTSSRRLAIILALAIVCFSTLATWAYFVRVADKPLSEDAVLTADVARMAASVPGRVLKLNVRENSKVARGDELFSLDPEFYALQVDQARAGLQAAEALMDTRDRGIRAEQSNATIAQEQIERARSNVALTTQSLQRLRALLPKGYVTVQQVDEATTLKRNAEISLKEAHAQLAAAQAMVGNTESARAMVAERQAALAIAERQLRETKTYAPNAGHVVGLSIAEGDYLVPAQSTLTLINTASWHASATFLETELDAIRPGDCATVYVASDRSRPVDGVVQSIGWGVPPKM